MEEIEEMIRTVDRNGDGKISYSEFRVMLGAFPLLMDWDKLLDWCLLSPFITNLSVFAYAYIHTKNYWVVNPTCATVLSSSGWLERLQAPDKWTEISWLMSSEVWLFICLYKCSFLISLSFHVFSIIMWMISSIVYPTLVSVFKGTLHWSDRNWYLVHLDLMITKWQLTFSFEAVLYPKICPKVWLSSDSDLQNGVNNK